MSDQFAAIFRRRPNDGWFRAGRYDVTTTDIVCVLAVASMFVYGLGVDRFAKLTFVPAYVRDFEIWRIFTWPIATEPQIWPLLGLCSSGCSASSSRPCSDAASSSPGF